MLWFVSSLIAGFGVGVFAAMPLQLAWWDWRRKRYSVNWCGWCGRGERP